MDMHGNVYPGWKPAFCHTFEVSRSLICLREVMISMDFLGCTLLDEMKQSDRCLKGLRQGCGCGDGCLCQF
jgi:hypothetical protein